MDLVASQEVHVLMKEGALGVFVSAGLFLISTAVVSLVVKVSEADPAELVRAVGAVHVLAASFLVNEIAALGAVLSELGHPFRVFSFRVRLLSPFLHHLAVSGSVRLISTAEAETSRAVSAADLLIAKQSNADRPVTVLARAPSHVRIVGDVGLSYKHLIALQDCVIIEQLGDRDFIDQHNAIARGARDRLGLSIRYDLHVEVVAPAVFAEVVTTRQACHVVSAIIAEANCALLRSVHVLLSLLLYSGKGR